MRPGSSFAIEGSLLAGSTIRRGRLVVRGGRLEDGGDPAVVWKLGPDLLLAPAFHDHHTHLIGAFRPRRGPSLEGSPSRAAALDRLRAWLAAHPGDDPVLGEGWDESEWEDSRLLVGSDLDAIEPRRLVALRRVCGHRVVVNRAAWDDLRPVGADAIPETGTLLEALAIGLSRAWPPTEAEEIEGARLGQAEAARQGVTGIDELGTLESYRAFETLARGGELFLRVRHTFPITSLDQAEKAGIVAGRSEEGLCAWGAKAFLDGSFGARTAAVEAPYRGADESGVLLWETADLVAAVKDAAAKGFAVALHAIGGRAVRQAVEVFASFPVVPGGSIRRVEHAEEADPDLMARGSLAGIVWSMQPNFTARWQGTGGLYETALGEKRAARLNRYRSAAEGVLVFGSDCMPFGPLYGLRGAIDHPAPEERLAFAEAMSAYSMHGLRGWEPENRLAPRRCADLIVLRIPGGDPVEAIREGSARVVWTCARGATVFCDPSIGFPLPRAS